MTASLFCSRSGGPASNPTKIPPCPPFGNLLSQLGVLVMAALPASVVFSQDPVPSYTAEQLRQNAISFLAVRERKQPLQTETVVRATEFKGYVAGILDARTGAFDPKDPDPKLSECVRRKPVSDIAHRAAVLITTQPLDRSMPAPVKLGISLYLACDDSLCTSSK